MDIVEAINDWIDEVIDDLTDDELEFHIRTLDVVRDSGLASLSIDDLDADDFESLVSLFEGDAFKDEVEILLDDVLLFFAADPEDPTHRSSPQSEPEPKATEADTDTDQDTTSKEAEADTDTDEDTTSEEAEADAEVTADADSDRLLEELAQLTGSDDYRSRADDDESGDQESGEPETGESDVGESEAEEAIGQAFYSDLAEIAWHKPSPVSAERPWVDRPLPTSDPTQIIGQDALAPRFLTPEEPDEAPAKWKRALFSVGAVAALVGFVFGAFQLINDLNADPVETVAQQPAVTPGPEPTAPPVPTPAPTASLADIAPPSNDSFVAARVGIVDDAGQVFVFDPGQAGTEQLELLYDSADGPSASRVAHAGNELFYLLGDGSIQTADLSDAGAPARTVWDTTDGNPAAIQLAAVNNRVGFIAGNGSIRLVLSDSDPTNVRSQVKARKAELGQSAVWITSTSDRFAALLELGDVITVTSEIDETDPVTIWDAAEQGRAARLVNTSGDLLMIILEDGSMAVLDDADSEPTVVWDTTDDSVPRPGVLTAGVIEDGRFALALTTGDVVLFDPAKPNEGDIVWRATADGLPRAAGLQTAGQDIVFLVEGGTAVYLNLRPGASSPVTSIWDVSGGERSPAVAITLIAG